MNVLADVLVYFNDVDDDEVLRLYEQGKAIYARVHGGSSHNVAASENNLAIVYRSRAKRAHDANDLDRVEANLQLALPHLREAVRICRAINHPDKADEALGSAVKIEQLLRLVEIQRAAAAAAATAATAATAAAESKQ